MTLLAVTFFKAVEFRQPIRGQRDSTPCLGARRVRDRQSAHLTLGARRVLPAAALLHLRRRATRPRACANSTNRL